METSKANLEANKGLAVNEEAKRIAIIGYITVIGLVIAFVMNNEKKLDFAKYHIRQSIGLCVTGLVLGVIGIVPIIGWLINIVGIFVLLYMWIVALMNAINGKEKPAPFLGTKYQEWFKGI
ncbi:DUF4870 domain-containing protein [Pseudozobellia thermophila]|uniref:Uncharacterized membrane protein n=1 Tax=Pseudozobellia thermophila TaxID=192903 RepID=A0A1M6C2G2_9FLAO|nr:hypothetical protein [Pseudozobellia thermophila]SHI55207.1 Uncharacterized membrane protein [Pseudozobellia thermophila]